MLFRSIMAFNMPLMSAGVSASGSFSQSCSALSASGVGIVAGSLRYSLSASLISKSVMIEIALHAPAAREENRMSSEEEMVMIRRC